MLIRPAIGDTDPIRYRRPTPDDQFSGNILDEAMRPPYRASNLGRLFTLEGLSFISHTVAYRRVDRQYS
jgi:hypothetical protein